MFCSCCHSFPQSLKLYCHFTAGISAGPLGIMKMGPTSEKQNNPQNHNIEIRHGSNNTNVCE